jgi:hypothetical protein
LKNAKFKRAKLTKGEERAWVSVPLEATAQLPIEAELKASASGMAIAEVFVNGLFGIEVRAIDLMKGGKGVNQKVSDKITWKFSYERTKGPGHEEDSFLYARLAQNLRSRLWRQFRKDMIIMMMRSDEDWVCKFYRRVLPPVHVAIWRWGEYKA